MKYLRRVERDREGERESEREKEREGERENTNLTISKNTPILS